MDRQPVPKRQEVLTLSGYELLSDGLGRRMSAIASPKFRLHFLEMTACCRRCSERHHHSALVRLGFQHRPLRSASHEARGCNDLARWDIGTNPDHWTPVLAALGAPEHQAGSRNSPTHRSYCHHNHPAWQGKCAPEGASVEEGSTQTIVDRTGLWRAVWSDNWRLGATPQRSPLVGP